MRFKVISFQFRSRMGKIPRRLTLLLLLLLLITFLFFMRYSGSMILETSYPGWIAQITDDWPQQVIRQGLPQAQIAETNQKQTSRFGSRDFWEKYKQAGQDPRGVLNLEFGWVASLEQAGRDLLIPTSSFAVAQPTPNESDSVSDDGWVDPIEENLSANPGEPEASGQAATPNSGDATEFNSANQQPLIAIYTTHNAETYIPTDGKAKVEGENGGVAKVAQVLKETLENEYQIPTVYVSTIHDYPDWSKSYTNSARTMKGLISQYPDLQMVIDLHRDALPGQNALRTKINGKDTARVLFIVGSDERIAHPKWRENLAYAQKIADHLEEMHPGFCRGVRIKPGTYNQQYHVGAILVEIGNDNNSLEEAQRAVVILAEALHQQLQSD